MKKKVQKMKKTLSDKTQRAIEQKPTYTRQVPGDAYEALRANEITVLMSINKNRLFIY